MATCKDCVFNCYTEDLDNVEVTCNFYLDNHKYVEVVRCKDCKHWQVYIDALGDECPFGDCSVNEHDYEITIETDKDDFCSYGERRGKNDSKRIV